MWKLVLGVLVVLSAIARDADAGARRSRPLKTGQTTCWNKNASFIPCTGTGYDGELQRGEPRAYVDNGDGTIRDKRTALTWEKLSSDLTVHDQIGAWTWVSAFAVKLAVLNTPPCFSGFCDWRVPTVNELLTLVDWGVTNPAISDPFNDCTPGCTVLSCSCTKPERYWTSSTYMDDPHSAWLVDFGTGRVLEAHKSDEGSARYHVRVVRGGS